MKRLEVQFGAISFAFGGFNPGDVPTLDLLFPATAARWDKDRTGRKRTRARWRKHGRR